VAATRQNAQDRPWFLLLWPFLNLAPGTDPERSGLITRATRISGDTMWTLLAVVTTMVLIPTIVLSLFRLAELTRAGDVKTPPHVDEWASSRELQTPK
jgi:hypothetical protein